MVVTSKEVSSMYVDYDIPVNKKLPQRVLDEISVLDKAYKEDDVGTYMLHEDSVEVDLRECYRCGILDSEEFKQMYRRFGFC